MSRADVLVDADWAAAHLDDPDIVLVEVDEDISAYSKGHIRGSVRIGPRVSSGLASLPDASSGVQLPETSAA